MLRQIVLWLLTAVFISSALADSYFFPNGTFNPDNNVTASCATALQEPISCLTDVYTVATTDTFYPYSNLTYQSQFCNKTCGAGLKNYVADVGTACAHDQPFTGLPATYYGTFTYASWNLTCLQDSTSKQYCVDYFFNTFLKYGQNNTMEVSFSDLAVGDLCVPCTTLMYQQIQGTPFSNYDTVTAAEWTAVQQKCGLSFNTTVPTPIANYTILPQYAPDVPRVAPICLSGKNYTVASGDNVEVIAESQGVATGTLIVLNQLLPDGSDLQASQVLCLPQKCQTYIVKTNDTCYSIATANGYPYQTLLAYNPTIDEFCTNLLSGRNICISSPGGTWNATTIAGATATQTSIYAASTVKAPGAAASGTTPLCGKYYQVQSGDYCQLIAINQTVSLQLFEEINPSINSGCTNLVAGLYYCLQPTENWNASAATTTSLAYQTAPAPTPTGTTNKCYEWYTVQPNDSCFIIEQSFAITFQQLQSWNPSLNSTCGNLILGDAYCVYANDVSSSTSSSSGTAKSTTPGTSSNPTSTKSTATSSTVVPVPTNAASGSTTNCYKWYVVKSGDTCDASIDQPNGITFAQFRSWNPEVDTGCSNIQPGLAYCVNSPVATSSKRSVERLVGGAWKAMLPPKFPGQDTAYDKIMNAGKVSRSIGSGHADVLRGEKVSREMASENLYGYVMV